jgi:hypothetical protein
VSISACTDHFVLLNPVVLHHRGRDPFLVLFPQNPLRISEYSNVAVGDTLALRLKSS